MIGFIAYSLVFICRSSFVIGGVRYFSLFDDAMITMRYARHLADGFGIVWNIGEKPIEGFTNQLWVFIMAAIQLLCRDKAVISLYVQLFGMILLAGNLIFIYKIALLLKPELKNAALGAVVLTGFYLPLNFWSLMGMEVSILTLITSASVWLTLRNLKKREFSVFQILIPAINLLIRPDAVIIYLVLLVFIAINFPDDRKKILILGISLFIVIMSGLTILRYWYFGDIFPNTYYLKMTGYPVLLRLGRGVYVAVKFIFFMALIFFFPVAYFFKHRTKENILLFSLFSAQIVYSIYVGGDAWEWWGGSNRFISIAMPLFFLLMAFSFIELKNRIIFRYGWIAKYPRFVLAFIFFLSLIIANSIKGPVSLSQWALVERPFTSDENEKCTNYAIALDPVLKASGSVLVNTAGVIPYFLDRKVYDMLGKNDRYIANLKMKVSDGFSKYYDFNPGHLKWDYSYSIGIQKPDVVVHLWKEPEKAIPFLERDYEKIKIKKFEFWFKKGSKNVNFEKIY